MPATTALMTDIATLRRELLAILADMDSDLDVMREKVEEIISEIERLVRTANDGSREHPDEDRGADRDL